MYTAQCPEQSGHTPSWEQDNLDRATRIALISEQLAGMGHALAGEVDPVLVAEFMLLSDRLERQLTRDGACAFRDT